MLLKQPQTKDLMRSRSSVHTLISIIYHFRSSLLDQNTSEVTSGGYMLRSPEMDPAKSQILTMCFKISAKLHRNSHSVMQ